MLLKAGCDKHAQNDDGDSPVDVAERGSEADEVLRLLRLRA